MKKYIFMALAAVAFSSCTEDVMDRINNRPDNPSDENIAPALQITGGIMETGYYTVSGDASFYSSSYTEQLVGVGYNQFYNAEIRNNSMLASSSTFNNTWNSTYHNVLNLKKAIAKAEDGGKFASQVDVRGMAKTMLALNYGLLTDLFGDVPCTEAGLSKQPKVDSQSNIYKEIFSLLDGAVADFNEAKAGKIAFAGKQDILFGGDVAKWEAFAYALKARYKLHLMEVDGSAAAEALAAAEKAIELGFDGAEITGFTDYASANSNPWAAFWGDRMSHASSKTVADLMTERNDPRLAVYATPWAYNGQVLSTAIATPGKTEDAQIIYGTAQGEGFALPAWLNVFSYEKGEAASIHLLSKAEIHFIIAELKARSGADYSSDLKTAIKASFDDYGSFGVEMASDADSYYASLSASLANNALKEIMTQKYLSQCRDEHIEAYNDIRRFEALGEKGNYVALTNPKNLQNGMNRFPQRLPYGNSDVIANPNVTTLYGDGLYIFSEKVWWAGGNR